MKANESKATKPAEFLLLAAKEAQKGMEKNHGGPFGAVVVRKGKVIAKGHNEVLKTNDPTSHAEILAIRRASKKLKTRNLSDCDLYASCEPCPMCLAAIHWAKIKKVFFGCGRDDAAKMGFCDKKLYDLFRDPSLENIKLTKIKVDECVSLTGSWRKKKDKKIY